jgi:hypothetical protein
MGICPNAASMNAMAQASAAQSDRPGISAKNKTWIAAAPMNTVRGPTRSSKRPTMSCPIEANANTTNASCPTAVADSAMPLRRSANTLGSANVVDWNTTLETAVVRNTIADTRKSSALTSAGSILAAALARAAGLGAVISGHIRTV